MKHSFKEMDEHPPGGNGDDYEIDNCHEATLNELEPRPELSWRAKESHGEAKISRH